MFFNKVTLSLHFSFLENDSCTNTNFNNLEWSHIDKIIKRMDLPDYMRCTAYREGLAFLANILLITINATRIPNEQKLRKCCSFDSRVARSSN